jgi:hypothetical protein
LRPRPNRLTLGATRPWITAGYVVTHRHPIRPSPTRPTSQFAEAQIDTGLTDPAKPNIITSIRGSRRQVADIKSEPRPASNRNRWPASYWNAWPASSESAANGDFKRVEDRPENQIAAGCNCLRRWPGGAEVGRHESPPIKPSALATASASWSGARVRRGSTDVEVSSGSSRLPNKIEPRLPVSPPGAPASTAV